MVDLAVLGLWLDSMILKVFSHLNGSGVPLWEGEGWEWMCVRMGRCLLPGSEGTPRAVGRLWERCP